MRLNKAGGGNAADLIVVTRMAAQGVGRGRDRRHPQGVRQIEAGRQPKQGSRQVAAVEGIGRLENFPVLRQVDQTHGHRSHVDAQDGWRILYHARSCGG